jgi:hypothetical protein
MDALTITVERDVLLGLHAPGEMGRRVVVRSTAGPS